MSAHRFRVLAWTCSAALGVLTSCSGDFSCLDDLDHDDPQCLHDATVSLERAGPWLGRTVHVRLTSGSGREVDATRVLASDETRLSFRDFIREGGGPYHSRVLVDLDSDGACDDPPIDAVWTESFDDDETLFVVDMGDGQSPCPP